MTVDLDTHMRSASESLVRASQRLSPAGPPRSLRPIATVVAAVVSAVALVGGRSPSGPPLTTTTETPRPPPRPCPG